jgi:hypothetical protein
MPSLLDPPDDRRFQPLLIQPPDEPPPDTSWSDALAETYRTVSDELARQQQISAERGLWTGGGLLEGGHPTAKGVVDAASQTAQGVLMGSTAPGAPRPVSRMPDLDVGERGMMAVPSLRSMAPADASVAAAAEPHLIPTSGGDGYVGAPSWVQTPEHIQQMRANLDTAIDAGAEGREWYGRTRDWTSEITGSRFDPATGEVVFGSPTDARNTAEGLAVFSPQSNPDTNLQFFLQARNAYERGQPVAKARTGQQAQTYNEGMAAKEQARAEGQPEPDIRQGPKTGPFAWHMSPDRPYGTTGVNDIWHARSFGYTNPDGSEFSGTPNEQQHKFMDYETVLAIDRANARASGGFTDWNAATVQAAPWVANKEANLRRRYPNWTDEEIRQEAHSSFPEVAGGATAYMPHEQVPGKSTGLLDLLPESEKGPFSAASTWRDPVSGRDMLTGNMFLQQRMPDTTGTYMNSAGQL